jgi:hypothetical protein
VRTPGNSLISVCVVESSSSFAAAAATAAAFEDAGELIGARDTEPLPALPTPLLPSAASAVASSPLAVVLLLLLWPLALLSLMSSAADVEEEGECGVPEARVLFFRLGMLGRTLGWGKLAYGHIRWCQHMSYNTHHKDDKVVRIHKRDLISKQRKSLSLIFIFLF